MTRDTRRALAAIGIYTAVVVLPLALAAIGAPSPRGFWIEFGVGLGFVGLSMLVLQFALTARFRRFAGYFGQDTLLQFHRQAALVAFVLLMAHPVVLFAAHPPFLEFLDPRVSIARAAALWIVTILLVAIIVTTLWRVQMRIPYEWWRLGHGILALFIVLIGIIHILRVNHYISIPWKQFFWAAMTAGAVLLLLYVRVLKPLGMLRRPYRIVDVKREGPPAAQTWTLTIEPDGHRGVRFIPGQFAWLTLGPSPFSLEQHPFSFASSADEPQRMKFTIKELGDFTSRLSQLRPGARAYMEGPSGAFMLDESAVGGAFIVGGIGITPIMSILRTLKQRGDRRPLLLVYANVAEDRIVFREELEQIKEQLNLRIVHVLEKPPESWTGESGRITPELLVRHLPAQAGQHQYLVCGPEPMMDVAEQALLDHGVPLSNIRSERFNIA